ncbi:hypothetical protein EN906_27195 [Mesorhizobium sp. M7A.F.Ca.CA.004.06.1.1]|uniref:hypothetical protein n=1 Tax=Mesorhizobium sp. M7A.F.Ca.CA.004.06.1.1 TaxID=2496686 RepID=UPI000FCBFD35|nr:hypothetical protein [Mesorhizobium sp. M7A.F.Ca.CA.004.06.1.1]RVB62114.1 hypothetical protein EN906_27195 [Mesorhizobium sp. M7A.F.Ca.CA.004.06.1.1]
MFDENERLANQEAHWLYAAMRAEKAIEQKDFARCARWKRILEILDESPAAKSAGSKY